jgi:hypothetical protein
VLASRADAADGPLLLSDAPQWAAQVASLEPAARAELAMMISDPARCVGELDRRAMATLDGLTMDVRRKLAAIVMESPPSTLASDVAAFITVTFGPPPAVTAPAVQRTDGRIELEEVIRLDASKLLVGTAAADADRREKKARRTGRREADRALRSAFGTDTGDDIDEDDDDTLDDDQDDESGTDIDDPDATETRATRRKTRTDGDSPMPTRRDDIRTISQPRSPGEQRAARERFTRSIDDEIRADHRTDAADLDPEAVDRAVQRDPGVRAAHTAEDAAHGAMQRRAMSVGRTPTTRTDAREQPRGTYASPSAQRKRFGLDRDGDGGNEAA